MSAERDCMERLTRAQEDVPETRLYTTACIVLRRDMRSGAEDFMVWRATDAPAAALYARKHHEHVYGTREPVIRVRVYNSCDTCPDAPYSKHDDGTCRLVCYGTCKHAETYTEYMTALV